MGPLSLLRMLRFNFLETCSNFSFYGEMRRRPSEMNKKESQWLVPPVAIPEGFYSLFHPSCLGAHFYLLHSAAIYGLRNKANVSIFILHPKGRVSPIQEAQMTTVTDANVHNVAVKGTFDDCQVCVSIPKTKYHPYLIIL